MVAIVEDDADDADDDEEDSAERERKRYNSDWKWGAWSESADTTDGGVPWSAYGLPGGNHGEQPDVEEWPWSGDDPKCKDEWQTSHGGGRLDDDDDEWPSNWKDLEMNVWLDAKLDALPVSGELEIDRVSKEWPWSASDPNGKDEWQTSHGGDHEWPDDEEWPWSAGDPHGAQPDDEEWPGSASDSHGAQPDDKTWPCSAQPADKEWTWDDADRGGRGHP